MGKPLSQTKAYPFSPPNASTTRKRSIGEHGNVTSGVRQPRRLPNAVMSPLIPRTQDMNCAARPSRYLFSLRQQSQERAIVTIARSCSQTGIRTQVLRGRAGARPTARKKSRTGVHELLSTRHQQTCVFSASTHLLVQPLLIGRNGIRN